MESAEDGGQLLPHAFCISASQPLLLLHLASDTLIAFAYLLIPWAMLNFVRKRKDVPYGWIVWVFGAFIVACGVTHAMQVWTLWYPVYWYSGGDKGVHRGRFPGYRLADLLIDTASTLAAIGGSAAQGKRCAQ